jgi:formylglycine-generating enzyme required for sulfatase activity
VAVVAPPVVPAPGPCGGPVTASFASQCAEPLAEPQERGLKPKDSFRECEDCPEMVVVPAGSFRMGAPEGEFGRDEIEGPQHLVTIAKPFAVSKFNVKAGQFDTFVAQTGYRPGSGCHDATKFLREGLYYGAPTRSRKKEDTAVCLSWYDAEAYVEWLAERTHKPYRLPSEAEWEYAARARTEPGAEAWASAAWNFRGNAFGLNEMFGIAVQWTMDCWHYSYKGAPSDGSVWLDATGCRNRTVRGVVQRDGDDPSVLRMAKRDSRQFDLHLDDQGIRVARTLVP